MQGITQEKRPVAFGHSTTAYVNSFPLLGRSNIRVKSYKAAGSRKLLFFILQKG